MEKVDRRIKKSREAIKRAVLELMKVKSFDDITIQDISDTADVSRGTLYLHYADKYDLLDKLIEEHIEEMRKICHAAYDLEYIEANIPWFAYLEENYLFFSTMLASKGAPIFRKRFKEYLMEEFRDEINVTEGKNKGLDGEILLQFIVDSYIGIAEWWIVNGLQCSAEHVAKEVGILLDRNL